MLLSVLSLSYTVRAGGCLFQCVCDLCKDDGNSRQLMNDDIYRMLTEMLTSSFCKKQSKAIESNNTMPIIPVSLLVLSVYEDHTVNGFSYSLSGCVCSPESVVEPRVPIFLAM